MLGVGASVDDVDVDTLTTVGGIEVFVPGAEAQRIAVRDTSKTPGGVLLGLVVIAAQGVDLRVALNVVDLLRVSLAVTAGT
jgi:hypothetical protein